MFINLGQSLFDDQSLKSVYMDTYQNISMTWRKYFILVSVQTSDHEQLDLNLKKLQTKFCCVDTVWGFVFVVAVN